MDDKKLISLFWNRNETAIPETSAIYGPSLHRMALRITGREHDAQECVNDTYLAVWNSIPPTHPGSFSAYIFRICRNFAFGVLDSRNTKKRSALVVELSAELQQCIPDHMAQAHMENLELKDLLNRFLRGLKREERQIFLRRYWYGDTVAEIAEHRNISQSKVKTQLFRTREKLREYLTQEGITV